MKQPTGLLIPSIYPDELADTYFDAFCCLNGFQDRQSCINACAQSDPRLQAAPIVSVVADICGMPVVDLVRFHTLTPFLRAFVLDESARYPHGSDTRGHLRHAVMRLPKNKLNLCKACVAEDREFPRRTYWRRNHQIPGVEWCSKHEQPLYESMRTRLQLDPYSCLGSSTRIANTLLTASGVVCRYIELTSFVSTLEKPISVSVLQDMVRGALGGTGIRISEKGKRPLLSDIAIKMTPAEWLARLIPKVVHKSPGQYFPAIDNAARGPGPSQAGAILALALLYENTDQCANILRSKSTQQIEIDSSQKQKQLPEGFWGSEASLGLYLKHKADVSKVADELGLSRSHVHRMLRLAGLPSSNLMQGPELRSALREFLDGESIELAVTRYNVNIEKLYKLLRYNVYAIRPLLH